MQHELVPRDRPAQFGDRMFLTDAEYAEREAAEAKTMPSKPNWISRTSVTPAAVQELLLMKVGLDFLWP